MKYRHHGFTRGQYTLLASRLPRPAGMRGVSLYSLHFVAPNGQPVIKFWHYTYARAREAIAALCIDALDMNEQIRRSKA